MTISFKDKVPFIEGVNLNDLTLNHQTPFYVYSQKKIVSTFMNFKEAINYEIFYAIKAN